MRTDEQIKRAVKAGQERVVDAQLEVLLDIRAFQAQTFEHLKNLLRKSGRPRKKNGPKPAM